MKTSLFRISLGLVALAAISACQSKSWTPTSTPEAMLSPNAPKIVYLKEGDRNPASEPSVRWEPEAVSLKITQSTQNFPITVDVKQVLTWQETEQYQTLENFWQEVVRPGTCYDLVCTGGGGKSPYWDAFFSAPKAQKPAALSNAIKGAGIPTATGLINGGYFSSKPKTWSAFASEINSAANSGAINKSAATSILNTYRAENAENLGYTKNNCSSQARSCQVYDEVVVQRPVTRTRIVEKRRVQDHRQFEVGVQVTNAKLLSTESEIVQFRIDEHGVPMEREVGGSFNRYVLGASPAGPNRVMLSLTGSQRILRGLSSNVVRKDSLQRIGGVPTLTIEVDPTMLPTAEDQGSQLVADYKLMSCELNWLGTGCKMFKDYKTVRADTKILTTPTTMIPMDLPQDEKIWVDYTVRRLNSSFYDNLPTSTRQTESLQ